MTLIFKLFSCTTSSFFVYTFSETLHW